MPKNLLSRFRSRARRSPAPPRPMFLSKRLAVETLEERRLLSVVTLDHGDLTITGSAANDELSLMQSGGDLLFGDAHENITLAPGVIGTGSGTSSVRIDPADNPGFTGAIVFRTLAGDDTLTVDSSGGSFSRDLVVTGSEALSIEGSVLLSDRDFTVSAETLQINADVDVGGGAISVTADTIDLLGTLAGSGELLLRPRNPAASLGLGGAAGSFNLDDAELARLADGFSAITVGDVAAGSGAVNIDSATFRDPLTIAGGVITDNSGTDLIAPSITLAGNVSPAAPDALTVTGDLVLAGGSTFTSVATASASSAVNDAMLNAATIDPQALAGEDFYHLIYVVDALSSPLYTSNPGANAVERAAWQVTFEAFVAGMVPGWDGLEVTWRPFMSMAGVDALDHLDIVGPIFNMQGELVAADANTLLHGGANSLANPIQYGATGFALSPGRAVFAGTSNGLATDEDCNNWESNLGSFSSVSYTTTTLYDGSGGQCTNDGAIIGISPPIAWPTTAFGRIDVTGTVTLGSNVTLNVDAAALAAGTIAAGDEFLLINNDAADPVIGSFAGLAEGATVIADLNGFALRISYTGGSNQNDVVLVAGPLNTPPVAASVSLLGSGLRASNGGLRGLHTAYRGDFQGDVTTNLEPGTYTVSTQGQFIPYGTFTVGVDATGYNAVIATTGALVELSPNQVGFDLTQLFAVTVFGDEIQATREFQGTTVSFHQPAILTGIGHINYASLKGNTTFHVPDGTYSVRTENSGTIGGRGTYGTFTVEDNGAGTSLLSGTTGALAATGGDVHFDLSKLAEITVLGTDLITPAGRAQQVLLGTLGAVNRGSAKGDLTIHAPAGPYVISSGVRNGDAYGQFTVGDDGSGNLAVTETAASATLTGSTIGFDLSQLNRVEVAALDPGSLPKTMLWAIDEVVGGGRTDDTLALPNGTYRF